MNNPLVSVIIPTYNRAGLIGQAIGNVFDQTYTNLEVIVVDDGSTDDTARVLDEFARRIRVVSQGNAGPAAARNRGAEMARGEIIAFQDSDDAWMPGKLERQVALLERAGPSVPCCLCNATMYFTGRPVTTSFDLAAIHPGLEEGIWSNVAEVLATTSVLFNQCAAIRADALRKVGGFDESLILMEDYDLTLRLALEGNSWAFLAEPLVVWRQGSPESLWEKSRDDEIYLRECAVKCLAGLAGKLESGKQPSAELRRIVRRELKGKRRELAAARVEQSNLVGASVVGGFLKTIERYRRAIHRRSPWYPSMLAEPLQA
jgi:glycosyltransferase involved in cell wall biosynthesis